MTAIHQTESASESIRLEMFRIMIMIRLFEEKIIKVYPKQDMKTPVHLYIGQEAIAAGVCAVLNKEDYLFTNHRSHGHCIAKGADIGRLYAEFYGRVDGYCRGKGGSMHIAIPEIGICGTSAIVGGGIPLAAGTALASKMKDDGKISAVFFGDGAVDEGVFHESLNFAALKKLPVLFICENNSYAVNSPVSARQSHDNIWGMAEKYKLAGVRVDGNDADAVHAAALIAAGQCRNNEGPTLIECRTYRWKGHVGPDCDVEKGCRPRAELDAWTADCPIKRLKHRLIDGKIITEETYQRIRDDIGRKIDRALEWARKSPFPDREEVFRHVYHEGS